MLNVFRQFYGSGAWAAKRTGVNKTTISQWLNGRRRVHVVLSDMIPKLAEELLRTNGRCMERDVNGESVRRKVERIREQARQRRKG